MLIAVDGACKRNGDPTCSSAGVAWIQTNAGDFVFKSSFETQSTSQRGEINGLRVALQYAIYNAAPDEDIIIVTDSEYLHNTVTLEWCFKWERNDWIGSTGKVKNADLWQDICVQLNRLNKDTERVFLQWTKGHILPYTPGKIKQAMKVDPEGIELYTRVCSIANRSFEKDRIISDFKIERIKHDKPVPPDEIAFEWVIANTVADCLASYIVGVMDELMA